MVQVTTQNEPDLLVDILPHDMDLVYKGGNLVSIFNF